MVCVATYWSALSRTVPGIYKNRKGQNYQAFFFTIYVLMNIFYLGEGAYIDC